MCAHFASVAVSATSYYKAVLCGYFSAGKKNPKVLTKTLIISHSSFSGTFLSQKTSNKKVGYSRSAMKYNTAV